MIHGTTVYTGHSVKPPVSSLTKGWGHKNNGEWAEGKDKKQAPALTGP